jgi:hypothetical protein
MSVVPSKAVQGNGVYPHEPLRVETSHVTVDLTPSNGALRLGLDELLSPRKQLGMSKTGST